MSLVVWTEKKLQHCFSTLSHKLPSAYRICLFIDGLDECVGDHHALIDSLKVLGQSLRIKCCVPSRPEKPFARLGTSLMLELQDLTRSDIRRFTFALLSQHVLDLPLLQSLTQRIVSKAAGVFLWADLVVRSLIQGLRNQDDEFILLKRVESLPDRIEELYSDMLKRIDRVYLEETARFMYLTEELESLRRSSIFNYSLAIFALDDGMHLRNLQIDLQMIISKCAAIKARIEITCGGLLEISQAHINSQSVEEEAWRRWEPEEFRSSKSYRIWSTFQVNFHPRTASDFFKTHSEGATFIKAHLPIKKTPVL